MKQLLRNENANKGALVGGEHLTGRTAGIYGTVSTDLTGDVSGLTGNATGIHGPADGISGDLNACELTDEDRERGVALSELCYWHDDPHRL
jgi:hypothetical protein